MFTIGLSVGRICWCAYVYLFKVAHTGRRMRRQFQKPKPVVLLLVHMHGGWEGRMLAYVASSSVAHDEMCAWIVLFICACFCCFAADGLYTWRVRVFCCFAANGLYTWRVRFFVACVFFVTHGVFLARVLVCAFSFMIHTARGYGVRWFECSVSTSYVFVLLV